MLTLRQSRALQKLISNLCSQSVSSKNFPVLCEHFRLINHIYCTSSNYSNAHELSILSEPEIDCRVSWKVVCDLLFQSLISGLAGELVPGYDPVGGGALDGRSARAHCAGAQRAPALGARLPLRPPRAEHQRCPDAFVYNFKSGDLVSCLRDAIELQTVPSLSTQAVVGSGLTRAGGSTAVLSGLPSRSSGSKTDLLQSANKENATGSSGSKKAQKGGDHEKARAPKTTGAGVTALACMLRKHITAADLPAELYQGANDARWMPSLAGKSVSSAIASLKSSSPT